MIMNKVGAYWNETPKMSYNDLYQTIREKGLTQGLGNNHHHSIISKISVNVKKN
eukprot:UN03043